MVKCGACGKFLKGGVVCPLCKSHSHHECVRIPVGTEVSETWRCGECQSKTPKGRDPSTPVRALQDHYVIRDTPARAKSEEPMVLDDTAHNITTEFSEMEHQLHMRPFREELLVEFGKMQESITTELKLFREDFRNLRGDMGQLRSEMADFRSSLLGVTTRLDGFEQRLVSLEQRLETVDQRRAEPAAQDVAELERTVALLKRDLNDRDQEALLSDIEIGQLPEERGESVVHTVTVLAARLGVPLEERDVVFAERIGMAQGAGAGGEAPRARRVVVRLARRELRDALLAGARVRRTLTAADAGRAPAAAAAGPRIFINERLTSANRRLFHRVREECRRLQWRYAWTKRGRVYARQGEGKPAFPFQSEADVARVFGLAHV